MLYNPLKEKISRTINIPLYYTGLKAQAVVSREGRTKKTYKLDRAYNITLSFTIEPESYTWFVIE